MWINEYSAETQMPPSAIWKALVALHTGELTYEGADKFDLKGPFAVGTEVLVTPAGQDTFRSVIVDVIENVTYADQTSFENVNLLFRHTLTPTPEGTLVSHRLEISGDGAAEVGPELGPQISGDFDVSMAKLFEQAKRFA